MACVGRRPEVLDGPTVVRVAAAPLSGELSVTTDLPTTLAVRLKGDGVDLELFFPEYTSTHLVELHALRADTDLDVHIDVETRAGRRRTEKTEFHTGSLPDDLPRFFVVTADPDRAFRGWILLSVTGESSSGRWLVAVDPRDGEIGWLYDGPTSLEVMGLTERGTMLGMSSQSVVELDWLGRERGHWAGNGARDADGAIRFDASAMSHDVREQDGQMAVLASRSLVVPAYPVSYETPDVLDGPTRIEDVEVVVFAAEDGAVTGRWPLSERLDTTRIGFDSLDEEPLGFDWVHANAVLPYQGGWLVGSRHQDALVSLDAAGDVRWILSNPYGWADPAPALLLDGPDPAGWPFHAHGPSIDREGNIVVLDNGNDGHTPYTEDPGVPQESRVLAWTVNEEQGTAETAWAWSPPDPLFSDGMGNAAALANGDVIANFPVLFQEGGADRGERAVRVFQFTPGEPDPALDLRITSDARIDPGGVGAYRAIPVPTFWPAEVSVERR